MNLRLCALVASTLLTGCVFTDATNQTGGDFLQAHGASVLPSDSRAFGLSVVSVEVVPLEGVHGSHGTEDAVLGSLGGDSLRLVLGFNLRDSALMDSALKAGNDSLTQIRLATLDVMPSMGLRARFVVVHDSLLLPGLLAGIEPAQLESDGLATDMLIDTSMVLPALDSAGKLATVVLPGAIASQVRSDMSDRAAQSWLVVLLDSRTGSDARVRFDGLAALARTPRSAEDKIGLLRVGGYGGYRTWRSIGFRPQNAPLSVGWWSSGGNRVRIRVDAERLRQDMRTSFQIAADTSGGFDNTFNVLQARISAPFAKTSADVGPGRFSISSSAIEGSLAGNSTDATPNRPGVISLTETQRRICGLTVDPQLVFQKLPGGYQMEIKIENALAVFPTQQSLAMGSSGLWVLDRSFLPLGDSIEFRISGQVRVRVKATSGERIDIRSWFLEQSPVGDLQYDANDILRSEAQLAKGGSATLVQEVRTPLTQLLNRKSAQVEFDLTPLALTDHSSRFVATPADPAKIFDSVKVVVRPLLSRNN